MKHLMLVTILATQFISSSTTRCLVTDFTTKNDYVVDGIRDKDDTVKQFFGCSVSSYCSTEKRGERMKCSQTNTLYYICKGRLDEKIDDDTEYYCNGNNCQSFGPPEHKNNKLTGAWEWTRSKWKKHDRISHKHEYLQKGTRFRNDLKRNRNTQPLRIVFDYDDIGILYNITKIDHTNSTKYLQYTQNKSKVMMPGSIMLMAVLTIIL